MHELSSRRVVQKPWGRSDIGIFNGETNGLTSRIGEIWFDNHASDVLVKYLFTSDRLSIQVHPDDRQARQMGGTRGKEECWLILEAQRGAHYGIGLKRDVSLQELERSALDGTIVDLMDWREALAGDFIYNPAGTVHALGPGLTVLEVQQNSDITLRLFDYFSDRPLHLKESLAVAKLGPHHHELDRHIDFTRTEVLVEGPMFGVAYCNGSLPATPAGAHDFQLVTWKNSARVGSTIIPVGSNVRLDSPDLLELAKYDGCFLVWSAATTNS